MASIAVCVVFVLGLIAFLYFANAFLMPLILALLLSFHQAVVAALCVRGIHRGVGAAAVLAVPLLMTFKVFCDHLRPLASIGEFLSE